MIDYLVSLLVVASALAVILLLMGRHKENQLCKPQFSRVQRSVV